MKQLPLSIGVDIGGTHISCAAVNLADREFINSSFSRSHVDSTADAATILDSWAEALNSTISQIDTGLLAGIGFAMPGPFDYRNGVSKMEQKYHGLLNLSQTDNLTA